MAHYLAPGLSLGLINNILYRILHRNFQPVKELSGSACEVTKEALILSQGWSPPLIGVFSAGLS